MFKQGMRIHKIKVFFASYAAKYEKFLPASLLYFNSEH